MSEERRVAMTVSCTDTDYIPKVDDAGSVFETSNGRQVQVMHNGIKTQGINPHAREGDRGHPGCPVALDTLALRECRAPTPSQRPRGTEAEALEARQPRTR